MNKHTFRAAGSAIQQAQADGKSPEEIRAAGDAAADAEYARIKGTPAEGEVLTPSDPEEDTPQELGEDEMLDRYLMAVLDIAHGQFENLSLDRKRNAALVVNHRVASFGEFEDRLNSILKNLAKVQKAQE